MKILVESFLKEKDCTVSKLYIDGVFKCFTMEDEIRTLKVRGETAIPEGIYEIGLRWSPKFSPVYNHKMLWILNVPGFEFVLIHWGNTDDDTDGCLLLGDKIGILNGQTCVEHSRDTYLKIYKIITDRMNAGEKVTIEYKR